MQITLDALPIHGGYGYSTEFDVERYFRDAPLMSVGEGTNEIERTSWCASASDVGRWLPEMVHQTTSSGRPGV